jgi:drug/metabolite transporter (DMT)-like permease
VPKHGFTVHDAEMVLVATLWGGNFSVSKFALLTLPPLTFTGIRFLLASLVLYLVAKRAGAMRQLSRKTFWSLAGLGVVGNTLYQAAFINGLSMTSATNSAMIVAILPVMVAVLGAWFGIERASPLMWLGVVLGTAGVLLVVTAHGVTMHSDAILGDALVLFATVCWSFYTVGVLRAGRGVNPLQITTITAMAGTPGLVLLGALGVSKVEWSAVSTKTWAALLYAALLSLVFSYILYNRAVQAIGSGRTAIYNCFTPLVAMLVAWLTLGEVPLPLQFLGVALVIGGVLVSVLSTRVVGQGAVPPE